MNKINDIIRILAVFLMFSHVPSASASAEGDPMVVWPREAIITAPTSLSDFIAEAIPEGDSIDWGHLQNTSVMWVTEGLESEGEITARIGYARIRANGVVSKVLRQSWEELAWSVKLSTEENPKWGPTSIEIQPGFDDAESKGKYLCFGVAFSGCSFEIDSLSGSKLSLTRQCIIGSGSGQSVVMRAKTANGKQGTVVYRGSGGSGGYSNWVEITILSPIEYCTTHKDRGY